MRRVRVMGRAEIDKINLAGAPVISCVGRLTGSVWLSNPGKVLTLVFDDVLTESLGQPDILFSRAQAIEVLKFVNSIPEDSKFYIHCDAGISRSAGIARALEFLGIVNWENGDAMVWDVEEKWRSRFAPNSKVFSLIVDVERNRDVGDKDGWY